MRIFELAVAGAAALSLFAFFPRKPWSAVLLLAVAAVHLVIEGYRWQMLPLYVVLGANVITILVTEQSLPAAAGGIGIALGVGLGLLFPVTGFPAPDGPYAVGTQTYHWVDDERPDPYTPERPRQIMVQVWYPAQPEGQTAPWLPHGRLAGRQMAEWVGLPPFILGHLGHIPSHAYQGAPLEPSIDTFPVILHIHGWGGLRNIAVDQLEELASQGYVVISADHTHGALLTVFPDGEAVPYHPEALPDDVPDDVFQQAAEKLVRTYEEDARFMLDRLPELNEQAFEGQLDLARIGVYGHSTGGGAAVQVCARDDRCQAVLAQDAWVVPTADEVITQGVRQPLLLIGSEGWGSDENQARQRQLVRQSEAEHLVVEGIRHYDFTTVPLLTPVGSLLGFSGPLGDSQTIRINQTYLVAFFDQHLRGLDEPLPTFPDIVFPVE